MSGAHESGGETVTQGWRRLLPRGRFAWAMVVIVVVAFGVRLAWVLYAGRDPVGLRDPLFYREFAERIASGKGYVLPEGDPTAYYPIGWPAVLAANIWLTRHLHLPEDIPLWAGIMNAAFGAATVAIVGVITRRVVNAAAGVAAAAVLALFPGQIFYTATLLSEPLFGVLLVSTLLALVPPTGRDLTTRRLLGAGVLLGAAALTRPLSLMVLPFLAIAWAYARWGGAKTLRSVVLVGAGALILIVPWTVRNVVRMGEVIPISTNTGDNLCIGHNPKATGAFSLPEECFKGFSARGTTEDELRRYRVLTNRAIDYTIHHPQNEVPLLWWRTYWTYYTDDDGLKEVESFGEDTFIPPRGRLEFSTVANAYWWGVVALAIAGVGALWTRADWRRLVVLAFLVAMFVSPLPFFGDARFKLPFALLCAIPAGITLAASPRIRRDVLPRSDPSS